MELGLGPALKNLRNEKGLSLREAARRAGVSHPYLSQLENGKNDKPSLDIMDKLAKTYDITLDELMSKAYFKTVFVGFADDFEKQTGIKIQKQNEKETPVTHAANDILFNIKSNPNVSLNMKPIKHEDRQRMEDLLKAAFPEYFK